MRTIVITGASDGIGAEAAKQLATCEDRLVLVGRSPEKTKAVADATGAEYYLADFTSLDQVRRLGAELNENLDRIDVLANNAGGIFSGPTTTGDGFEKTFQVNHLAPYLLTHELLNTLIASNASVINTASIAAKLMGNVELDNFDGRDGFTSNTAYGTAKLANILLTKGLHQRFHDHGVSAVAFHPGVVATNFASDTDSYFGRLYHGALNRFMTSPQQGGQRLRHFIDGSPGATWVSGEYYRTPKRIGRTNKQAYDPAMVEEHWRRSAEMLNLDW